LKTLISGAHFQQRSPFLIWVYTRARQKENEKQRASCHCHNLRAGGLGETQLSSVFALPVGISPHEWPSFCPHTEGLNFQTRNQFFVLCQRCMTAGSLANGQYYLSLIFGEMFDCSNIRVKSGPIILIA
jgi:hypothetical protein